MMENVYVIKVRTKPPLSSLYPSERRYSASTIGGLSFVHFGLGALSLLLGTLALSVQGPILSIACLVPFTSGLLAWRRWYIDRNIAIFFYGSLFSLVAAILCFVITVFDIAAVSDSTGALWSLEKVLDRSHAYPLDEIVGHDNLANRSTTYAEGYREDALGDATKGSSSTGVIDVEDSLNANTPMNSFERESAEGMHGSSDRARIDDQMLSYWRENHRGTSRDRTLLTVNVLVASLLEVFWSMLSAKIALRGMMNRTTETNHVVSHVADAANAAVDSKSNGAALGHKRRPRPAPRPDILDHDHGGAAERSLVDAVQNYRSTEPRLPLPESSREFRERVERFLANQAAHRIVEGSYA